MSLNMSDCQLKTTTNMQGRQQLDQEGPLGLERIKIRPIQLVRDPNSNFVSG